MMSRQICSSVYFRSYNQPNEQPNNMFKLTRSIFKQTEYQSLICVYPFASSPHYLRTYVLCLHLNMCLIVDPIYDVYQHEKYVTYMHSCPYRHSPYRL